MWEEDGFEVHVMLKMECMHSRLLKLSLVTSVNLVEPTGKGTRSPADAEQEAEATSILRSCASHVDEGLCELPVKETAMQRLNLSPFVRSFVR